MTSVIFNRNPIVRKPVDSRWETPTAKEIKNSPQIINASLDDAMKYGGEIARQAIQQMNLSYNTKHILVDSKVHMLMPGMSPAIPGWHTDAVPRNYQTFAATGAEAPDILAQENLKTVKFHLLETGTAYSHTEFIKQPVTLEDEWVPDFSLYANLNQAINFYLGNELCDIEEIDYNEVVEFDWWNIHRACPAKSPGWRFLIRITETDYSEPFNDLRDILRTQQQVYVPENFGW